MSDSIAQVRSELENLGLRTYVFETPQGMAVAFDYTIETGSHRGEEVVVAVSFQETQYPAYPPHWVHVSPPLQDGKSGAVQEYSDAQGRRWLAMSRPPGDMWDRLPQRHMSFYLNEHLRRIWKDT